MHASRPFASCVCNLCTFFRGAVLRRLGFFLALSTAEKAMGPSVHYDPAELRDACNKHSRPLSWLFCQGDACRLTEASRCVENPTKFCQFLIARSALTFLFPLRSPAHLTTSVQLFLPSLLSATYVAATNSQQQQQRQQQQQQQQQHICRTSYIYVAPRPVTSVIHLALNTQHTSPGKTASLRSSTWEIGT